MPSHTQTQRQNARGGPQFCSFLDRLGRSGQGAIPSPNQADPLAQHHTRPVTPAVHPRPVPSNYQGRSASEMLMTLSPWRALLYPTLWALREGCNFLSCGKRWSGWDSTGFPSFGPAWWRLCSTPGIHLQPPESRRGQPEDGCGFTSEFSYIFKCHRGEMVGGYHRPNGRECEEAWRQRRREQQVLQSRGCKESDLDLVMAPHSSSGSHKEEVHAVCQSRTVPPH